MTIYILDNDPKETAKMLDDKSLDRMIKTISHVLCNVWHDHEVGLLIKKFVEKRRNIPLNISIDKDINKWSQWVRECKANYEYLVEMGFTLYTELTYRFGITKFNAKYRDILRWCYDNVPALPIKTMSSTNCPRIQIQCRSHFPIVMPKKFLVNYLGHGNPEGLYNIIESYRNYYQAKLKKSIKCDIDPETLKLYGETCEGHHSQVKWTRREKPSWLVL
jgi:hypothetical protein